VYETLLDHYGSAALWPVEAPFDMMVRMVLLQNSSRDNVEKALNNLRQANVLNAQALEICEREALEEYLRPTGFFRKKAKWLLKLCLFYREYNSIRGFKCWPMKTLRHFLLNVQGIGPRTADSILLFAIEKPVFIVDTGTKRIFHRLGILPENITRYDDVQHFFQQRTPNALSVYQQFHALTTTHAKECCRNIPRCTHCPLLHCCQYGATQTLSATDMAQAKINAIESNGDRFE